MQVIQDTMLFTDISPEERKEMLLWITSVVLNNKIPSPDPKWLNQWMEELDFYGSKRMIAMTNTFLQRLMLSLILDGQR